MWLKDAKTVSIAQNKLSDTDLSSVQQSLSQKGERLGRGFVWLKIDMASQNRDW